MEHEQVVEEAAKAIRRMAVQQSHPVRKLMMSMADLTEGINIDSNDEPGNTILVDFPYKVDGELRGYVQTFLYADHSGLIKTDSQLRDL